MDSSKPSSWPRSRYYLQKMKQLEEKRSVSYSPAVDADVCGTTIEISPSSMSDLGESVHKVIGSETTLERTGLSSAIMSSTALDISTETPISQMVTVVEKYNQPAMNSVLDADSIEKLSSQPIEEEKLAWIGPPSISNPADETETTKSVAQGPKKDELFEARFDTSGKILSPNAEVPLSVGLHHHGNDPDKPGYTLDEILILLQSSNQAQKLWAIGIFTAIVHRAKMSQYDDFMEEPLLGKILDEGMVLPLRYLLDESVFAVVNAAVIALHRFLCNDADEVFTDSLIAWRDPPHICELHVNLDLPDPAAGEEQLNDAQLINSDVVKGLLRTGILDRFKVIVVTFLDAMDAVGLSALFGILTRFIRHSPEVAESVAQHDGLMSVLMDERRMDVAAKAPVAQMKFVRVLCQMLGPVQYRWAGKFFDDTAAWIGALRHEIRSVVVRDMITESLNLLIVSAHYKEVPAGSLTVFDVFPQLLFSAGPKPTYRTTKWDSEACSRVLTLLSLYSPVYSNPELGEYIDKVANVVIGNLKEMEGQYTEDFMMHLKAAHLRFLTGYITFRKPSLGYLSTGLVDDLIKSVESMGMNDLINAGSYEPSRTDPVALPSYMLVLRGGDALHPAFQRAAQLDLCFNIFRYLDSLDEALPTLQSEKLTSHLEEALSLISSVTFAENDFWCIIFTSAAVRLLVFSINISKRLQKDFKKAVFKAALNLAARLDQNHQEDLRRLLTDVVFSESYCREFIQPLVPSELLEDMKEIQQVYQDLSPLGFGEACQLVSPSRDPTVFEKLWVFESFDYIIQWSAANRPSRVLSFIRGYFGWLTVFIPSLNNVPFSDLYASLSRFFDEAGMYRDEHVAASLKQVLKQLMSRSSLLAQMSSRSLWKKRPLADFYVDLLDNFSATSYGDPVFSMYILIPIAQRCDIAFRMTFWGPEKQLPAMMRLHHLDLVYPVKRFLEPAEANIALLRQYLTSIVTRNVTETRNPLMYLIAVAHLNSFLKRSTSKDVEEEKFRARLIVFVSANEQNPIAQHILRYDGPSADKSSTVRLLENLPVELSTLMPAA